MKKLVVATLLLLLLAPFRFVAQSFNGTVTPATFCYNANGNSGQAGITSGPAGAVAYSCSINSPVGASATFTAVAAATPSVINITYTGCGTFTINCYAINNSGGTISSISQTVGISCLGIAPATQTICNGSVATLSASGAASYTWSSGVNTATTSITPSANTTYTVIDNYQCAATATVNVLANNLNLISTSSQVCAGHTVTLTVFGGANSYSWQSSSGQVVTSQPSLAVGAGTYAVVSGSPQNPSVYCSVSTTLLLSPPLNISVSQSSPTTCIVSNAPKYSKPVMLTASGASSYTWLPNTAINNAASATVIVRPQSSLCYTVYAETAVCSGSAVACVSVTPQFTVQVAPQVACLGQDVNIGVTAIGTPTLGPVSAFTYSWNFSLSAQVSGNLTPTVTIYQPYATTVYTVEVTDGNSCVSLPSSGSIVASVCTGVEALQLNAGNLQVYPNPAQNVLFVRSPQQVPAQSTIEITDIAGRQLLWANYDASSALHIDQLPPGLYTIVLKGPQQTLYRTRFVKE